MNMEEYHELVRDRKDLRFPTRWRILNSTINPQLVLEGIYNSTKEELIAARTAKLLGRENPWLDGL